MGRIPTFPGKTPYFYQAIETGATEGKVGLRRLLPVPDREGGLRFV